MLSTRRIGPLVAAGVAALALGVGPAAADAPAKAPTSAEEVGPLEVVHIGGGTWSYGSDNQKGVWSDYYHDESNHGSSVEGTEYHKSPCVKKGKKAHAWSDRNPDGGNKAWWRKC